MALSVSVVSAQQEIFNGEADQVIAKTVDGEIGILRGHEPMLAILTSGTVRVKTVAGETVTVDAEDGFLSVDNDSVTIVAGKAQLVVA